MALVKKAGIGVKIFLNENQKVPNTSIYSLKIFENNNFISGRKILIVNLASKCGFTPQYDELESLYKKYEGKLVVLGFPSNNFGGQEPGSDEEIASFCKINFGVTFPLFPKRDVKGKNIQEIYEWLSDPSQNGWNKIQPQWNFFKYLVDEKGILQGVYSSAVSPFSPQMINAIENEF